MDKNRIKEVFSDKEYVEKLLAMKSFEDAQKSLEEKDIDLSVEDLRLMRKLLKKRLTGELTDKELEEVAGGAIIDVIFVVALIVAPGASTTSAMLIFEARDEC